MAVTSGFFNSVNGDRKYNAEQMSAIFDGIINDGVFANIGTAFSVKSSEGNTVNVGIGKAWFNSTWIYNDAILPITLEDSELVLDRIDAIVIEVDRSSEVRNASIKAVKGTPATSPKNPVMTSTDYVHQHPLAYILRKAGSSTITQANITNMIGTSSCPYITGILQVQNIDKIVAQWQAQWIEWFASETAQTEDDADRIIAEWTQWYSSQTSQGSSEMSAWMAQMQSDFNLWLQSLKDAIGDDPAATLAADIVVLQNKFDTLMREKCIYDAIEDSSGRPITDKDGLSIEGKTVFGTEGDPGTNTEVPIDNTRLISTYVHVKNGTVHDFVGRGENGRAKITDNFVSGDTFAVNGVHVSAYVGADAPDGDTIVKDRWVTFIVDGDTINFRSGGGLTNTKLALATAEARDVIEGITFYSGNKTMKMGTLLTHEKITSATYLGTDDTYLYVGIPFGAYRGASTSGYPEIRARMSDVIPKVPGGDRANWGATINPGASVTIPKGYHNGSGVVRANTVQSQLKTATASLDLMSGEYVEQVYFSGDNLIIGTSLVPESRIDTGRTIIGIQKVVVTNGTRVQVTYLYI